MDNYVNKNYIHYVRKKELANKLEFRHQYHITGSRSPCILTQTQPDADVLAVQPQDAANVPRDHRDAAGGPAPVFPGGLLLLQ